MSFNEQIKNKYNNYKMDIDSTPIEQILQPMDDEPVQMHQMQQAPLPKMNQPKVDLPTPTPSSKDKCKWPIKEVLIVFIIFILFNSKFIYYSIANLIPSVLRDGNPSILGIFFMATMAAILFFIMKKYVISTN